MIIEASKMLSESRDDNNNGEWENVYQLPIQLNKSDVVSIKNIFIDTSNNNSQNITLNEDVEITFEIGYYWINAQEPLGVRVYHNIEDDDHTEYDPFIARYKKDIGEHEAFDPYLREKKITIPKGSYTPSYLCEYMNEQLTKITFYSSIPDSDDGVKSDNPFLVRSDILGFHDYNGQEVPNLYFVGQDYDKNTPDDTVKYFYFAKSSPPLVITHYQIGASQVVFTWNKQGNGLFSINYLHTPLLNDHGDEIIEMRQRTAGIGSYHMYGRRCGVFFTKIESTNNFLDDVMGFDTQSMIYSFNDDGKLNGNIDHDIGIKTINGFVGIANLLQSDNSTMRSAVGDNKTLTDSTTAIMAKKQYNPEVDGGFILLSISGLDGDYHQDDKTRSDIRSIISRQYSANNYITSFGGAGINYVVPNNQLLTSLHIRILDPKTREPINNLGPNSSIFLEVTRNQ